MQGGTVTAGRKRAAIELVAREEAELRRTARRFSLCEDDAEDAYQRALEILLVKAPSERPLDLLRWTKTVVKHEALALRRYRERMLGMGFEEVGDPVERLASDNAGPDERTEQRERNARTREALRALKPAELRSLTLLAAGYSYAEIGEMTGYSRTKVNRSLAEGRERFRRLLGSSESGERCEDLLPLLSAFCDGEASAASRSGGARAPARLRHLPRDDALLPHRPGRGRRPGARAAGLALAARARPGAARRAALAAARRRRRCLRRHPGRRGRRLARRRAWRRSPSCSRSAPARSAAPPAWRPGSRRSRSTFRRGTAPNRRSSGSRGARSTRWNRRARGTNRRRRRSNRSPRRSRNPNPDTSPNRNRSRKPAKRRHGTEAGAVEYAPPVEAAPPPAESSSAPGGGNPAGEFGP